MGASEEYFDALSRVADFIPRIGDELVEEIDQKNNNGVQIDGYRCLHGDNRYVILASPEGEKMEIKFEYYPHHEYIQQVLQTKPEVAKQLDESGTAQVEVTEQHMREAQQFLISRLSNVEDSDLQSVRQKLVEILSGTSCGYGIQPQDQPMVLSFNLTKNIFPQSDNFDIQHFNDDVQLVITQGVAGRSFIQSAYKMQQQQEQVQSGTTSEDLDSGPGPTAFQ